MVQGQDLWYTPEQSDNNQQPIRPIRSVHNIRNGSNNTPKKSAHITNSNRNGYKNHTKSYTFSTANFGLIN